MTTAFDEEMWICDVQSSIVMFGGGKGSAPKAPDYTSIYQTQAKTAQDFLDLSKDQYKFYKEQYNKIWPYAQDYLSAENDTLNEENTAAKEDRAFYKSTYKPIESDFAKKALEYNSPENAEAKAAMAMQDVQSSYTSSRKAALQQLESYGIDPSQTRWGALDLGYRIEGAAATAAAGTQSRLNTEATGLALEGEAINVGRGYSNSVANSYTTATNAGKSGISSANDTSSTGSSTQGSAYQYGSLGLSGLTSAANTLNTGYQNSLDTYKTNYTTSANQSSGIGKLFGSLLSFGSSFL